MHIKGAKHVAAAEVQEKVNSLGLNKTDTILVYCNLGNNSAKVCRTLSRDGYANVKNLKGGLTAWQDANLPVTTK
jgi:rhodanese-related sulfurtransferase